MNKQIDFVLAAKMTESMLRLKNKVSFRDMEGYVETGSQEARKNPCRSACRYTVNRQFIQTNFHLHNLDEKSEILKTNLSKVVKLKNTFTYMKKIWKICEDAFINNFKRSFQ